MQVNSISSQNVETRQSFGQRNREREALERFAELDDRSIRHLAYQKASVDVNDKKHRRISSALYYNIPLAAGLAAAVRTPAVKNMTRSLRLRNFGATALSWAATFAAIDLIFAGKRKLDKASPAVKDFSANHPIVSTLATIGASIGAIYLGGKGISKLAEKALSKSANAISNKFTIKQLRSMAKLNQTLNNSKFLNSVSEQLAKVPSSLKNFAKGVVDYGPILLICSSIAHSFNHENVKARQVVNNYNDIKEAQANVRNILANEELAETEEV